MAPNPTAKSVLPSQRVRGAVLLLVSLGLVLYGILRLLDFGIPMLPWQFNVGIGVLFLGYAFLQLREQG